MFRSALGLGPVFLFLAAVCALFGFGIPSSDAGVVAKALFVVFLALAVLSFAGVLVLHGRDAARRGAAWLRWSPHPPPLARRRPFTPAPSEVIPEVESGHQRDQPQVRTPAGDAGAVDPPVPHGGTRVAVHWGERAVSPGGTNRRDLS